MKRLHILIGLLLLACGKPPEQPAPTPQPKKIAQVQLPPAPPTPAQLAQKEATLATVATRTDGFVVIPAGHFQMGAPANEVEPGTWNDAPLHEVTISRPFELQVAETTQEQYEKKTAGKPPGQPKVCPQCPVVNVSWFQAIGYCNALSRERKLPLCYEMVGKDVRFLGLSCRGYRLPTESEWEYAARAGTTAIRYGPIDEVAWIDVNSQLEPQPVMQKQPNPWGLFDMLGNAFEWVQDWQAPYPPSVALDPLGPDGGENRVFRGGSYRTPDTEARPAFRNAYGPANQVEFLGFRCARTL